jgi:hypothetical protein
MKFLILLIAGVSMILTAAAQERLEPASEKEFYRTRYHGKIRQVFAAAYREDVILRVVMVPSFRPESIAGIRKTDRGYEAFAIAPQTAIYDTYMLRQYQSGEEQVLDDIGGKPLPPEKIKELQDLKRQRVPSNYQRIHTQIHSVSISGDLAERVIRTWRRLLIEAKPPDGQVVGLDGDTYRFELLGPKSPGAETWSPTGETQLSPIVKLGIALDEYAKGNTTAENLKRAIDTINWPQ